MGADDSTAELSPACCRGVKASTQRLSCCVYRVATSRRGPRSVNMLCAQVEPPAVSGLCIDRQSRATLTCPAASPSSDPAENEFFKPVEKRAAALELRQTGILRPRRRLIYST